MSNALHSRPEIESNPAMNPEATPIVIPRWMLTTKYVVMSLLGVAAIASGIGTFREFSTWEDYTLYWGVALTVSASLAAVGSTSRRTETLEKWSVLGLVSFLGTYLVGSGYLVVASGFQERVILTLLLLSMTAVPTARLWYLITRSGVSIDDRPSRER